ncbi:class I SAM-dependent methyltransferase [Halobacillus sp. BBL2006]|uniref:class I SAM-dependent methyltransferase n=1 Tax=Halobacillus sp. BBL2006 TaxID=1543706 RepID=UPI0005424A27|nr:class I SAM-dependent methyltransferase [Halobacillus sp. BBL2006]KHE72178.1 SAM-dependent methyltransferase [Halobacillus sp. BBL2006]
MSNITHYNQKVWNKKVEENVSYTQPVSKSVIEKSNSGNWEISVTASRKVPRDWFPENIRGMKILCLASGGGQQGPVLAAAGADVTVVDISERQLEQDRRVAERDHLSLKTIQGEMTNLHFLDEESFDLIVHPVANLFIENVRPVWKEAFRVLKQNGSLISGFMNPVLYLFNDDKEAKGILDVQYKIPYSPISTGESDHFTEAGEALEFGHTLEDQIQGQTDAGFLIAGFYEDDFGGIRTVDQYIKTMIATRAIKMGV